MDQTSLEESATIMAKVQYDEMPAAAAPAEVEAETETAKLADKTVATVFTVKQRQTIPSSSEKKKVTIAVETLPVEKEFLSIPKLAESVSLNAKITNAADFTLLPGQASLFFDNDYVSTAPVPLVSANDHFSVGVGAAPGVKAQWRLLDKTRTETGQADDGILTWSITLAPMEKKEIRLKFRITHPKSDPLIDEGE